MHVAMPYRAISPMLEGELLVILAGTTRTLSGRDVARLAKKGSQSGVNRALHRLVEHGLVTVQNAGCSLLYTLNRQHLAAPIVELMAGLREEFLSRMRKTIRLWRIKPVHASLFGSAARADGDTSSDIDIFLVRPRRTKENSHVWRNQVDIWVKDIETWTGNRVGLSEVGEGQIRRLRRLQPEVVLSLIEEAIALEGISIVKLMGETR